VVETTNFFMLAPVNSLKTEVGSGSEEDASLKIYKPEETPVILAAKRSYLGRVYLSWAAYPITQTETLGSGYLVNFQDLRYAQMPGLLSRARGSRDESSKPLGAGVQLDQNLSVIGDVYGSGAKRKIYPEP
jgi:inner membrane protein